MNSKISFMGLILVVILISGCYSKNLTSAEFTNLTPAEIKINNVTYQLTTNVLTTNNIEKEIGKVTKYNEIISYLEKDNPYKNPGKIFKVKGEKEEEVIGIEVNNKIYKATVKTTP